MFLPKFIQILSTKLAKCAIYRCKFMFVWRNYVRTLYITNNNAIFAVCLRVCLQCVVIGYSVGYIPKLPPLQTCNNLHPIFTTSANLGYIFAVFVFVCRLLLRWINTYSTFAPCSCLVCVDIV